MDGLTGHEPIAHGLTGAQILATTNTGCHMQYLHGVKQAGLKLPVLHLVELLDRAYECE